MKQEKLPLDVMAVLTCGQCGHKWAANWEQSKALQSEDLAVCPQCSHPGELSKEQHTELAAHLDKFDKVSGKGVTRLMLATLVASIALICSLLGVVPIGVFAAVMIPTLFVMFTSSSETKKLVPLRLALSSSKDV